MKKEEKRHLRKKLRKIRRKGVKNEEEKSNFRRMGMIDTPNNQTKPIFLALILKIQTRSKKKHPIS